MELVEIFTDTQKFYATNAILREAVSFSVAGTKYYPSDFSAETESHKAGIIRVAKGRTLQSALALSREFPGRKIAVLNFASPTKPGGGVFSGSKAQEESICRSSTLYPSISTDEMRSAFYDPHREDYTFRGWDDCIYSPGVVICRDDSDEIPARLDPEDFVKVDVITCAAPHLKDNVIRAEDLFRIHVRRARNIMRVCAYNGADILVTGAFGCGAFQNDPYIVAWAWREALKDYRMKFELVQFTVYVGLDRESSNYRAFRNEFAGDEGMSAAMIPTKTQLAEVFRDTLKFFAEESILAEAIANTNTHTRVYAPDFRIETDAHKAGIVRVVSGRTLRTALELHAEFPDMKIAALNFAASQHPGGRVYGGSRAQEESLCRSSTLYPSLITDIARKNFYDYHAENCGWAASDTCIYSPDVVICRDDSDYVPARLSPEDFVKVDVITCAAPHLFRNIEISEGELYAMHLSRARNILRVCAFSGADILVTGAFGCGAFHNPPEVVAEAWREALSVYREKFELVVFAVYCAGNETGNYAAFRKVFRDMLI